MSTFQPKKLCLCFNLIRCSIRCSLYFNFIMLTCLFSFTLYAQTDREDTNELCSDGIDNDGDNWLDCYDEDCQRDHRITVCETSSLLCGDGIDNDGDGLIDCDDADCTMPFANECPWVENSDYTCSDFEDNNDNGFMNCDDYSCSQNSQVTVCANGADAWICDNGCYFAANGICEDGGVGSVLDTLCDWGDDCFDCGGRAFNVAQEITDDECADGLDNDGDGYIDCDDHDCYLTRDCGGSPSGLENQDSTCSDGMDNDGDGYIDCDDYDCSRNSTVSVCTATNEGLEDNANACADGIDNDGDGFIDCQDWDCEELSVCTQQEVNPDADINQTSEQPTSTSGQNAEVNAEGPSDNCSSLTTGSMTSFAVAVFFLFIRFRREKV